MQDLYLKVSGLNAGVEVHSPSAFLYRLASNLMLDRLRQRRRGVARDTVWRDLTVAEAGGEAIADTPNAEHGLAAKQRLAALLTALNDLPQRTQAAFRMHKVEGLSHTETAERLGVSRSAVEKHISAALRHLIEVGR